MADLIGRWDWARRRGVRLRLSTASTAALHLLDDPIDLVALFRREFAISFADRGQCGRQPRSLVAREPSQVAGSVVRRIGCVGQHQLHDKLDLALAEVGDLVQGGADDVDLVLCDFTVGMCHASHGKRERDQLVMRFGVVLGEDFEHSASFARNGFGERLDTTVFEIQDSVGDVEDAVVVGDEYDTRPFLAPNCLLILSRVVPTRSPHSSWESFRSILIAPAAALDDTP